MKMYRFGSGNVKCFTILIEEDDGELRTATVGLSKVVEHIAKVYKAKCGSTRLVYANGSSVPYKDANGKMSERWIEIK